ncbi:hypothetical protein L249_7868 [Ophiocordyceps polyrhachis-furcata BCC 54312]|uniref:Cep57 centrosome microtubule-binding domain-containing protein n=1 Tax=Ophiocordyceps polyrhachis-furcata BCC 54312 TaxID=1330021 RepID=A0A367L0V7_9HYPO|nr:hypothetical protein L249_7868 [Ophiocordyceps polyrhachis-furcata BCC 54312]
MDTDRYRSRILREVQANRANPFNSPPSSTGSHGSDSPTLSSVFSDPDGESTRRLQADIARVTAPRKLPVNWEMAHRKWPEFFSLPSKEARTVDDSTTNPLWTQSRAEMQPRVDDESDMSPALRSAAKSARISSPVPKAERAVAPASPASHPLRRKSSITEALDRLRRASLSPPADAERRLPLRDSVSPQVSSAKSSLTAVPPSPASLADADAGNHGTSFVRSFLMPDVSHLGDFVTGTLKFSGSMKNGVPIFVKNGKVHDRRERPYNDAHAAVDGIEVPQVEEKIFVSMDMIRDEIVSLQKHHDQVQQYAENLQKQVHKLETQVKSGKHHQETKDKGQADSGLVARNNELELEVASLQARLDASQRKASDSEMERMSLAHEKDRAVSRLQSACDDISKLTRKLSVKEKELESTHKQLETTDQVRQDNDTLRRDLLSLKHGRDEFERENASLRSENEALRKEVKKLREEIESLRSDNNSLQRGDDENRSLRSNNRVLSVDNENLRDSLDGVQHELDAVREEVERLERRVTSLSREKTTLEQDNQNLVQHNDKYFSENNILRREKSSYERSTHELHEIIVKLKDEVAFLKQQPDHCRPLPRDDDVSVRVDEETEENMTSAFFVPDITINTNESAVTETAEMAVPVELTSRSHKTATVVKETAQQTRGEKKQQHTRKSRSNTNSSKQPPKVAFAVPDKDKNLANKGSKRRNPAKKTTGDDTTDALSLDGDQVSMSLNLTEANRQQGSKQRGPIPSEAALPSQAEAADCLLAAGAQPVGTCPAVLSPEARRVLDGLCEHNCRNCVVCSRITAHRGVITSADVAAGKKRVSVTRPVPVTDRNETGADDDVTTRPSQPPGRALALVIKGLEDEAQHMQFELSRLQARYNASDKSLGRRQRLSLADAIRSLLKRLEVKNDQIYSLFDVLEGQKAAGQAMSEDEVELTVLSITGLTIRDLTGGAELLTWDGFFPDHDAV